MLKIKHRRAADCVVAGLRWHTRRHEGGDEIVGSLLLGLYDGSGRLNHVGSTSSFTMEQRRTLAMELAPLRTKANQRHPWFAALDWASGGPDEAQRLPGAVSRWGAGKDPSWIALRPERVCAVRYDHLQNDRFRHATTFVRWRPDRRPSSCTYDQLEVAPPFALRAVFDL